MQLIKIERNKNLSTISMIAPIIDFNLLLFTYYKNSLKRREILCLLSRFELTFSGVDCQPPIPMRGAHPQPYIDYI